jgi:hypothetical protein
MKKMKKGITVGEYLDLMEKDPEYVKRKEKQEQEHLKAIAALQAESSAFVQECSRFGYDIKSPGGLAKEKNLDPDLIPIMIKYLSEPQYSKGFRLGLASSLLVPEAAPHFNDILDLFKKEQDEHVRCPLGEALSAAAKKQDNLDVIESLIYDKEIGPDRSLLLDAVKRMKGEQRERALAFAREDPELKINLRLFGLR